MDKAFPDLAGSVLAIVPSDHQVLVAAAVGCLPLVIEGVHRNGIPHNVTQLYLDTPLVILGVGHRASVLCVDALAGATTAFDSSDQIKSYRKLRRNSRQS